MLNPRSIIDPASSWGSPIDKMSNASGVTFDVKFMGYVPLPNSINHRNNQEKDAIVKICVRAVVNCRIDEQFQHLLADNIAGKMVTVDRLKVFLNIADYTLTFFHHRNGRTFLLGRYRSNKLSHYKIVKENNRIYIGMVMIKNHRETIRECNVLELSRNETENMELLRKLEVINIIAEDPVSNLDARLKSTREYTYEMGMIPFYHGNISHLDAARRLQKPGEFLIRDMTHPEPGRFAVSYMASAGNAEKMSLSAKDLMEIWQRPNNYLKYPVLREPWNI